MSRKKNSHTRIQKGGRGLRISKKVSRFIVYPPIKKYA
jgi:hypothetical protein